MEAIGRSLRSSGCSHHCRVTLKRSQPELSFSAPVILCCSFQILSELQHRFTLAEVVIKSETSKMGIALNSVATVLAEELAEELVSSSAVQTVRSSLTRQSTD